MTNVNLTEIVCVIDRSSSMSSTQKEVIDGFNRFIEEQKAQPGVARVTLTLFDTHYETLLDGVPINEVATNFLSVKNYQPSGMTALLDSVGRTIDLVGQRLSKTSEEKRPGKLIFLIMTDGEENSSQEYLRDKVPDMIKHQREKYNWEFVFLGANIDSFHHAQRYNIGVAANYSQHIGGTKDLLRRVSNSVSQYRLTGYIDATTLEESQIDDSSSETDDIEK